MKDPIYIFGHKNPDPDAICSAIAYAAFKKDLGHTNYIPARCGNSNARIDAALALFDTELPVFIGDVKPKVKDFMVKNPKKANLHFTIAQALEIMQEHDFRSLPVVDENNILKGMVSIFNFGPYFIPTLQKTPSDNRYIQSTQIDAIIRTLKATPIHTVHSEVIEDLYVRVAAVDCKTFGSLAQNKNIPDHKSIIIVGDRKDIQKKAIDMGVRLLVLTADTSLDKNLLEEAKAKNVSVITSSYDSATTTCLIRSASLIAPLVEEKVFIFNEEDRLSHVKKIVSENIAPVYCVCDNDKKLLGVFTKTDILKPIKTQIVLVDHNEVTQAVDGAGEVSILEIIDHHRLGNLPTEQAILFHNEPVGSTCTIVADLFRKNGMTPTRQIAGLMLAGLITDTYLLQSPTATPKDADILKWLEPIAQISAKEISDKVFNTGSIILSSTSMQVVSADCKIYQESNIHFSVAQVEEVGFDNFWDRAQSIQDALEAYRQKENLFVSILLVTDINKQDSILLVAGSQDFIDKITYPQLNMQNVFDMPQVVSRKKQLMPYLTQILKMLT